MREEYGMRWRGLDREMGLDDKLFFIDGEGKKRLYQPFEYLSALLAIWTR